MTTPCRYNVPAMHAHKSITSSWYACMLTLPDKSNIASYIPVFAPLLWIMENKVHFWPLIYPTKILYEDRCYRECFICTCIWLWVITAADTGWCIGSHFLSVTMHIAGSSWLLVSILFIVIPTSFFKFYIFNIPYIIKAGGSAGDSPYTVHSYNFTTTYS